MLDLTIAQLVEENLPAGFSVSEDYINNRLKYWQLLLWEAAGVELEDKYDIEAWKDSERGDEWLILLSYGITYDIYVRVLAGNFIAGATITTEVEGGEESETRSQGIIKKIVTGPTEVEYHESTRALADFLKSLRGEGGLFDEFMKLACAFAQRLGVKLPFCIHLTGAGKLILGKRPIYGKRYFNYVTKKTYRKRRL